MMKHSIGSRATTRKAYSRRSNNKQVRKYSGTKKVSLTKEADSGSRLLCSYFWDTIFIYPPLLPNKLLFCQISFKAVLYLYSWTFPHWSYRNLNLFDFPCLCLLLSSWYMYKYWRLRRELSGSKGISRNVKLICSGRESACQTVNVISIGTRR